MMKQLARKLAFGRRWPRLASPAGANLDAIFFGQREPVRGCLLSELFVAMMGLSSHARLPEKRTGRRLQRDWEHIFLLGVLIRAGHGYFGVCRESPDFIVLSHLRMAVYLVCVNYWIISLWREKQRVRTMTPEMRGKVFTLQMRLK